MEQIKYPCIACDNGLHHKCATESRIIIELIPHPEEHCSCAFTDHNIRSIPYHGDKDYDKIMEAIKKLHH